LQLQILTTYSKAEKVTAKAHGGPIDIEGVTVAHVNKEFKITKLETWMDPLEMFRQIAPEGIVSKISVDVNSLPNRPSFTAASMPQPAGALPAEGIMTTRDISACPIMSHRSHDSGSTPSAATGCPVSKDSVLSTSLGSKKITVGLATGAESLEDRESSIQAALDKLDLLGPPHTPSATNPEMQLSNEFDGNESTTSDTFWDPVYTPDDASTHEVKPLDSEPKPLDGIGDVGDIRQMQTTHQSLAQPFKLEVEDTDHNVSANNGDVGQVKTEACPIFPSKD
jgi:hypothetical protein